MFSSKDKKGGSSWNSSADDRASQTSMDSSLSNDHNTSNAIHHTYSDDVLDAMGIIPDDESSSLLDNHYNNQNISTFTDHRRHSEIKPDQKMVRPVPKSSSQDAFTQQSKLLSHQNDRRGGIQSFTDHDYGSTLHSSIQPKISVSKPLSNNDYNSQHIKYPVAFPTQQHQQQHQQQQQQPINPFTKRNNFPTQRSLLSQSVPISTISETYTEAKQKEEDNSIYASSNPSSRGSSEVSSLNDVCFPVDSMDEIDRSKRWPNISILEDFTRDELLDLKSQRSSTPYDDDPNGVNFQYPIVANVDYGDLTEPLIVSTDEEIDPINGRLRPKKRTPWNKPEFITKHDKMTKFRFTYFREDIPDTIHSPNISGLIHNGKKFEDLFSPSYYGTSSDVNSTLQDDKLRTINSINQNASTNPMQDIPASLNTGINSSTISKNYVQPFWLDVLNPTEDEMKAISKTFGIHPLTSEDIFLGEAREKVELFKDYYFVCFTSFDVEEEHERRKRAIEKAFVEEQEEEELKALNDRPFLTKLLQKMRKRSSSGSTNSIHSVNSRKSRKSESRKAAASSIASRKMKKKKYNKDELIPLTMYIVVFKDGVITFHNKPTPHTGNVRRRARLLRDYLTVTSDWIGYAIIDDITDAFAPLIESIETEVNSIEDEIITMQSGDTSDDSDSESESDDDIREDPYWIKMKRRNSNINGDNNSNYSKSTRSSSSSDSVDSKVVNWKKKGDMLRRIGNCRRRVMSLLRLLGSKADVIKGFSKRYNEQWGSSPRSEIGLYLGDIQDHIVTMVQNLNHYEKLLARSHSNYLAQINIDMTKVNNDMNDILGKITILGTIVLPLNIVTGLWGMNCLVPGQDIDNLNWFWMILSGMIIFSITCYYYVRRITNVM
ncbi:CorA metal ion transporter [Pichia californica]|nr:CorA metal ion transporter [[Candida] californica]